MNDSTADNIMGFIALLIMAACIGGWVANIVKLVSVLSDPITGLFILRCIGIIFPPLGIVLGFLPNPT